MLSNERLAEEQAAMRRRQQQKGQLGPQLVCDDGEDLTRSEAARALRVSPKHVLVLFNEHEPTAMYNVASQKSKRAAKRIAATVRFTFEAVSTATRFHDNRPD